MADWIEYNSVASWREEWQRRKSSQYFVHDPARGKLLKYGNSRRGRR
jgi:hypothetical protein